MPSSLKGWLWFAAYLACLVLPYTAKADDVMECISRGRLAAALVYDISEGADLASIKINAKFPPRNQVQQRDFDEWVAGVKGEVAVLLEGKSPPKDEAFANRLGVKVAEKCAVEYGMRRGDFKRTGSVHPRDAASSQGLTEDIRCQQLSADLDVIKGAVSGGMPIDRLKEMLKPAEMIGEETHARMIALIDSAYAFQGNLDDWMARHFAPCK